MKKMICMILAMLSILCLTACPAEETPAPQSLYAFAYQGQELAVHAEAEAVIAALGTPQAYSEIAPCGRGDLDKIYHFGSFTVQTYRENGKDYISVIDLRDDLVGTKEGISVGDTQQAVLGAYGEPTSKKQGTTEIWSYASGAKTDNADGMDLEFYFHPSTGTVKEIVYRSWN